MKRIDEEVGALVDEMTIDAMVKLHIDDLIDQFKDILSQTWKKEVRDALIEAMRHIDSMSGAMTWEALEYIEKRISEALGTSYAEAVKKPLISIHEAAYKMGMKEVVSAAGASFMWNLPDIKSLKILEENTLFWIGSYYDDNLQEGFKAVLQDYFKGGYNRRDLKELFKVHFRDLVKKPDSYWDLLADHTSTKIREIGRVSGYEQAGINYVQFRAHLDDRTTAICRSMHGRIIPVSSMRRQVDNYFKACATRNKDKIKKAWPWVGESKAKGTTKQMIRRNVSLPPLHARCRSTTVAYFGEVDASLVYGPQMKKKNRNVVNQWTANEHYNFADDMKFMADDLPYNKADFKHDVIKSQIIKHADRDMGISAEKYLEIARDTIGSPDRIFCHVFKGEVQYSFVSMKNKLVAVVDRNGMIRSAFYHGHKPQGIEKCLEELMTQKRTELLFTD